MSRRWIVLSEGPNDSVYVNRDDHQDNDELVEFGIGIPFDLRLKLAGQVAEQLNLAEMTPPLDWVRKDDENGLKSHRSGSD